VSLDRAEVRSTDPSNNEALIEKYGAVAYPAARRQCIAGYVREFGRLGFLIR
jgi:hypothetical protein